MLTLITTMWLLGTGNGSSPAPPVMPNTSVGCDPCKGVRTPPGLPNPPPVTGPSWTT